MNLSRGELIIYGERRSIGGQGRNVMYQVSYSGVLDLGEGVAGMLTCHWLSSPLLTVANYSIGNEILINGEEL